MFLKAIGIAFIATVILFFLRVLHDLEFFHHDFKHHPGICRQVKGLNFGSEDFEILSNGLTFITSGFAFPSLERQSYRDFLKKNDVKGRIYVVDMKKSQTEAKELKFKPNKNFNPSTFRPHGISVLENQSTGQHLLYVVNHCEDEEDRVEKFKYLPDTGELEHVKSFFSELFHLTNDLAVTKEDAFYISDYLFYTSHILHFVERNFGLKFGSILYYNGSDFIIVASHLCGPNGVTLSKDKKYLYTPVTFDKGVKVYEVKSDNSLRLAQELHVHTGIDNFHLSQDGESLYGAAHPIAMSLARHRRDPTNHAPSQVIHLPLRDGRIVEEDISETFYDHGDLISASSTASVFNKKLLIGSVMNKLVICDLPQ